MIHDHGEPMRKLLLLFMITLTLTAAAQHQYLSGNNFNISYITMENGLLHDFIDDIYLDSRGFIWISTSSGLSRYDGFSFINYHMGTSPISLNGNAVHMVREDNFNRLWIASDGGLDILNLEYQRIENLFDGTDPSLVSFMKSPVKNITKDSAGDIWLVTDYIYKIMLNEKGEVTNIFKLPDNLQSMRFVAMEDVDKDGNIWAGYHDNIFKLYMNNHTLRAIPVSKKFNFKENSIITRILPDKNEVWIGTVHGLHRYFRNEDVVKIYENKPSDPLSISHNYIADIVLSQTNQLIIGTLRGINIFNPLTDGFEKIVADQSSQGKGLNSNFINCLYNVGDIVWCGTETGGINMIKPKNLSIQSYTYNEQDQGSLSPNPVNVILEDQDAQLWVGTVEGGLNLKKKGEESFSHFTESSSTQLSHNSVSALSLDDRDRLWVGTWGYGISVINRKKPAQKTSIKINSGNYPGLLIDLIGGLLHDTINNCMWIGSNQGLYCYELMNDSLFIPSPENIFANIQGIIGMTIDEKGVLWAGSQEGVYSIDLESKQNTSFDIHHYRNKLDAPGSSLVEKITSLCLDSDNVLWLGSDGYGIYKRLVNEDGTCSFKAYKNSDGLANNSVRGILEDDMGYLWISTSHGLSRFDKQEESFVNFFKSEGFESDQFYWNAYHKSKRGTLYFGTLNGLIAINPSQINMPLPNYRVSLTNFFLENEKVFPGELIEKDITLSNKISLHEKHKSFTIEFSALNYIHSGNYTYSYRLVGYDEKWIELPPHIHSASFMNLPAGKYTFQVTYHPKNQKEFGEITELEIIIRPYFYKTTWFAFLCLIVAISIFLLWYFWHIRSYEEKQKQLSQIVDERTKELEKQKETLMLQKKELSDQNLVLSNQNEQITWQKNQLISMTEEVERMNRDKLEFFTNISHEFRTPVTLIMGPVQRALKLSNDPYVIEQLHYAERNSKYLLSLVNQLMDFQKIESGKTEINYTMGDFTAFIDSVINSFEQQINEREIRLRRLISLKNAQFFYDDESLRKIIINLLANAVKFTPNGGEITLFVKSITAREDQQEKLYISVRDSGTGIPEEDLTNIFRRYYQSRSHIRFPVYGQSGTGIGLYLCKQLTQMLGGEIWAKNNRKEGCTFRMLLPLHRNNPQPQIEVENDAQKTVKGTPILLDSNQEQWQKNRMTFLVVEDNPDMKNYICSILSSTYNTLKANNGAEALLILDKHHVDFIISDLMMPEMDGIELSKRVKSKIATSHIPFLMLTAKTSESARLDSYRVGVDSYLIKPFDEEMLTTRINNILKARQRSQQLFSEKMNTNVFEMNEESFDKKFMDQLLRILKENYRNPDFSVEEFAAAAGVSKSTLNNKLNALSGKSTGQFIRDYRLKIAYNEIIQNKTTRNKNISDIAYDVGFNDPKYFTRCFTRQFNVTPSKLLE